MEKERAKACIEKNNFAEQNEKINTELKKLTTEKDNEKLQIEELNKTIKTLKDDFEREKDIHDTVTLNITTKT